MIMNNVQADALCAIIALGFVSQNEREDRTNRTLYIYDSDNDEQRHRQLATLLYNRFNIDIATGLLNAKDADSGRKLYPFIYALPYGNESEARRLTYDEATRNEEELLDIVQITETAINSIIKPPYRFRGAYIGGFIDYKTGRISLIGPSSLYLRDRMYLNPNAPSPGPLATTYIDYAFVTRKVKEFLINNSPSFRTDGAAYENIVISPELTNALISEGEDGDDDRILSGGKIFSSCHGLVTSMYYHSNVSPDHLDDGVCIELSLSDDTCKSASCIPCAIFASSQGAPASAVHFGRGDFWNLPAVQIRESLNHEIEDKWRSFVIDGFVGASQEILNRGGFRMETMQMAGLVRNQDELVAIPEMFLDALTFEGAFIDKMINSLQ